jgi:hypothetical protein
MTPNNRNALALIQSLGDRSFWGSLTLKFENGRITHIRQEINFKPSELSGLPRSDFEFGNNSREGTSVEDCQRS